MDDSAIASVSRESSRQSASAVGKWNNQALTTVS